MILEGILYIMYELLDILLVYNLPNFPDSVNSYIDMFFGYLIDGGKIIGNYVPLSYLITLLGIIVLIDTCIFAYKIVMWIIRKLPISTE